MSPLLYETKIVVRDDRNDVNFTSGTLTLAKGQYKARPQKGSPKSAGSEMRTLSAPVFTRPMVSDPQQVIFERQRRTTV